MQSNDCDSIPNAIETQSNITQDLARKPGDENPFTLNPIFFINLLTMASAKGFDRILIGLEILRKQLFYA